MGRLSGKVALITGAAGGQGRSHAVRLAREGADVIAVDACAPSAEISYSVGSWDDLRTTVDLVEREGRRGFAAKADVRDRAALHAILEQTAQDFPRLDILVPSVATATYMRVLDCDAEEWREMIDVNLTGVFNVVQIFVPRMIQTGGGSVVIISSVAGLKGLPLCGPYAAAKHGVQGLMRVLAQELAESRIRVNTVNPGAVATPMPSTTTGRAHLSGDGPDAQLFAGSFRALLPLPDSGLLEPTVISDAVAWLASDESEFVTGAAVPVDAGVTAR